MSNFNPNKKIKFLPLPYIGMFDLDLIYQSSDVELLYQILSKVNEIAQSQNIIIDNFEKILDWAQNQIEEFTKEQLQEWMNDGTLENMIMSLGQIVKYFDTTQEMIMSQNLQNGQVVKTLGFSNINDRGNATFKITDTIDTNNFQFSLGNGKFATLIYENNCINSFGLLPYNVISTQTISKIIQLYKEIIFDYGTYTFDDTLTISNIRGAKILGKGCHFTTLKINDNSKECVIITNSAGDTENTSCIVHDLLFNADKGLVLDTCQLSQIYNLEFTCVNNQIKNSVGLCIRNNSHLNKCRNIKITNYETGLSISPNDHIVSNINECENFYIDYCLIPFDINGSRNVIRDSDIEGYNGPSNFNTSNGKLINVSFERNTQGNWLNIGKNYNELDLSPHSVGGLACLPLATITGNYNKLKVYGSGYTIANIIGQFNEIFFNGYRTIESQFVLRNYTPTTKFKTIGGKNVFALNESNLSSILKGSGFTLNGNQVICNDNDNNIYLDLSQYNITVGYFIVDFEVQAGALPNFNFTNVDGSRIIISNNTPKRLVCMYTAGEALPNISITGMVNTAAFTFKSLYISQDNPSEEMLNLL